MKRQRAKAQRRAQAFRAAAQDTPIPLPTRGLFVEAKDAKLNGLYAGELDNFRSNGLTISTRPGVTWAGESEPVLQRIPFEFGSASAYIEVLPSVLRCGAQSYARISSGRSFALAISGNIIIFDGAALPVRFNGAYFTAAAFTLSDSKPITTIDGAIAHHDRIIAWNSSGAPDFYYGDVGAVMGTLTKYPLSQLGNVTGKIVAMQSLTVDAGNGMNDVLAIFTSTGQIIVYEGLNPGDENDWRLSGRVQAATPVSPFAFAQVGGDLWMLSSHGMVSVGDSLRSSVLALVSDIGRPIATMIAERLAEGPADWRMVAAHDGSSIIINQVMNAAARQIVYRTTGRGWDTMNMAARDFHNLGGNLEVTGFDGRLGKLSEKGSEEEMTALWTSSWFDAGRNAHVHYVKPTIRSKAPAEVTITVLSDHNDTPADVAEAVQTLILEPEEGNAAIVTLSDEIGVDASGSSFQISIKVKATWAEIISLTAGIG